MTNAEYTPAEPSFLQAEQLTHHPELQALLELPFVELLALAATQLGLANDSRIEAGFVSEDDPTGEWSLSSATMIVAHNNHAVEQVRIQVGKDSISAIYESRYRGIVGKIVTPKPLWAVSRDTGSYFYWNEATHGDTATLFALAGTDCEEITPSSQEILLMREYISVGLYGRTYPEYLPKLAMCDIEEPNLITKFAIDPTGYYGAIINPLCTLTQN